MVVSWRGVQASVRVNLSPTLGPAPYAARRRLAIRDPSRRHPPDMNFPWVLRPDRRSPGWPPPRASGVGFVRTTGARRTRSAAPSARLHSTALRFARAAGLLGFVRRRSRRGFVRRRCRFARAAGQLGFVRTRAWLGVRSGRGRGAGWAGVGRPEIGVDDVGAVPPGRACRPAPALARPPLAAWTAWSARRQHLKPRGARCRPWTWRDSLLAADMGWPGSASRAASRKSSSLRE